ncbi:sigma-70 family RNA polymerase sigma factor [Methylomonas sp. AM2-LC]|uniref:sigma-70 family RNA polymerase sigma factor n=1 Tax=Methylomonas sp. AM2-LC TaxID=3153301 RepID=UPI003267B806
MDKAQIKNYREMLVRYALLQVQNEAIAEDAVQETLLAALQAESNFRNESAVKTWLIGILKHKIADHYRAVQKLDCIDIQVDEDNPDQAIEKLLFNAAGHWIGTPSSWKEPDHALEQNQFWLIFEWCQKNLPAPHARAFMLREMVGLEAEEICVDMDISHSACRVYLHRARLGLRECLELKWFNSGKV